MSENERSATAQQQNKPYRLAVTNDVMRAHHIRAAGAHARFVFIFAENRESDPFVRSVRVLPPTGNTNPNINMTDRSVAAAQLTITIKPH